LPCAPAPIGTTRATRIRAVSPNSQRFMEASLRIVW
jgi:hypothetical protein